MSKFTSSEIKLCQDIAKKWRNKEWLYQKYWIEHFSIGDIALLCNIDKSTIRYWMKKLGIKSKTKSKGVIDRFKIKPNPLVGRKLSDERKNKLHAGWRKRIKNNPDGNKGKNNSNWKGGKQITGDGYIRIYRPNHPMAGKRKSILEHRLVAEKALGRPLNRSEAIHPFSMQPRLS